MSMPNNNDLRNIPVRQTSGFLPSPACSSARVKFFELERAVIKAIVHKFWDAIKTARGLKGGGAPCFKFLRLPRIHPREEVSPPGAPFRHIQPPETTPTPPRPSLNKN